MGQLRPAWAFNTSKEDDVLSLLPHRVGSHRLPARRKKKELRSASAPGTGKHRANEMGESAMTVPDNQSGCLCVSVTTRLTVRSSQAGSL